MSDKSVIVQAVIWSFLLSEQLCSDSKKDFPGAR